MPPSPTRDYGVSAKAGMSRPAKISFALGALVAIGGAAAVIGHSWWYERQESIANAEQWTIAGPPCPQLTAEAFNAAGLRTRQGSEYNGIIFRRVAGNLSCNEIAKGGGTGLGKYFVCQFTAPSVLTVTTAKGEFYFHPGVGRNATVEVQDGVARCVLGGDFGAR